LAAGAPARVEPSPPLPTVGDSRPLRVAVAGGRAFTFTYTDTVDALQAGGAEIVPFDPVHQMLPDGLDGLVVGGGFPEVHAAHLAGNGPLLGAVRRAVAGGLPTWAECGGLLWLSERLDGRLMAGVVPAVARMTDRLTLGYRTVTTRVASPVGPAGTTFRGHEFHYAAVEPDGDALALDSRFGAGLAGFASPTLLASFVHHHPGGDPALVEAFLASCRSRQSAT